MLIVFLFFFFNDTATTEIYTLSLHDALPIFEDRLVREEVEALEHHPDVAAQPGELLALLRQDRKSTRLNSSHANISYAVFCLKKKYLLYSCCVPGIVLIAGTILISHTGLDLC